MSIFSGTLLVGLTLLIMALRDVDPVEGFLAIICSIGSAVWFALGLAGIVIYWCCGMVVEAVVSLSHPQRAVYTRRTLLGIAAVSVFAWYGIQCSHYLDETVISRSVDSWLADTILFVAMLIALSIAAMGAKNVARLIGMALLALQFAQVAFLWSKGVVPLLSMAWCNGVIIVAVTILARQCLAEALLVSPSTKSIDALRRRVTLAVLCFVFVLSDTTSSVMVGESSRKIGDDRAAQAANDEHHAIVAPVPASADDCVPVVPTSQMQAFERLETDDAPQAPQILPPALDMIHMFKELILMTIEHCCHTAGLSVSLSPPHQGPSVNAGVQAFPTSLPEIHPVDTTSVSDGTNVRRDCIIFRPEPVALGKIDV